MSFVKKIYAKLLCQQGAITFIININFDTAVVCSFLVDLANANE
jgi:hypothetical protein